MSSSQQPIRALQSQDTGSCPTPESQQKSLVSITKKRTRSRTFFFQQQARVVIAAPVTTTATAVYPSQEQYPGAPPQYTQFNYTAAPPYSAQIDPAPQYPAATGYAPPPTTEKY